MNNKVTIAVGTVVFVLSATFVAHYVLENWPRAIAYSVPNLVGAAALYAFTHISTTLAWLLILGMLGAPIPAKVGFSIGLTSQAAKYIPGNVAHHLSRVGLAKKFDVPITKSAIAIVIEICSVSIAALIVGCSALPSLLEGQPHRDQILWTGVALMALSLSAVAMSRYRKVIVTIALHVAGLALAGYSFALLLGSWWGIPAYALAWLIGFLLPGAPAGLGAREAALVAMLAGVSSATDLATAVVVHRVITALVDGVVAAAAYFLTLASIQRRAANQ